MKFAIICSLLVLILFINSGYSTMSHKQINYLKSLSKSEFGKTVLASIKLELQANTNNPVDQILASLDAIADDLKNEQTNADSTYVSDFQACNEQVDEDQANLDQSNADLSNYQAEQVEKQNFVETTTEQLNTNQQTLATLEGLINDMENVRNYQAENYATASADLSSSIAALQQGKQILQSLLASTGSFLLKKYQIKQKPVFLQFKEQFVSLLQSKSKGVRGFANFFLNLAQQPGIQADQAVVNKILSLMDDLLVKLQNDLQTQTQVENDRIAQYTTDHASLQGQIDDLKITISLETTDIADANARLTDLGSLIFDTNALIEQQSATLLAQQTTCSSMTDNYNTETANRDDELQLIAEVRAIFTSLQTKQDQMQIIEGLNIE